MRQQSRPERERIRRRLSRRTRSLGRKTRVSGKKTRIPRRYRICFVTFLPCASFPFVPLSLEEGAGVGKRSAQGEKTRLLRRSICSDVSLHCAPLLLLLCLSNKILHGETRRCKIPKFLRRCMGGLLCFFPARRGFCEAIFQFANESAQFASTAFL